MFRGDANRRTWVLLAVIWVEARAAVAWTDGTRGATLAQCSRLRSVRWRLLIVEYFGRQTQFVPPN